jgi:hypothetical protein
MSKCLKKERCIYTVLLLAQLSRKIQNSEESLQSFIGAYKLYSFNGSSSSGASDGRMDSRSFNDNSLTAAVIWHRML